MNSLLPRAIAAFLVLPGVVAFLIPLLIVVPSRPYDETNAIGWIPLGAGLTILLACVREFYVAGKGTLAPWAPPRHLVVTGLYRFSRNPMYVGVLTILCGWAVLFQSWPLAIYAAAIAILFQARIVVNEEPFLAKTHGDAFTRYRARVRRWL